MISLNLASSLPQIHAESATNDRPSDLDGAGAGGAGTAEGVGVGSVAFCGDLETKIEGMIELAL